MMDNVSSAHFEIIDRSQLANYPDDLFVSFCVDCACAVDPHLGHHSLAKPTCALHELVAVTPELRFESLENGYWAVFSPTSQMGIIVVDERSLRLLSAFEAPVSSDDVLQDFADDRTEVERAISRLMQLDLIRLADNSFEPPLAKKPSLLTAWLHITNACNLGCVYCYVDKSQDHMSEVTGRKAVDAVIRSALSEGYPAIRLKYAGGEASLQMGRVFSLHDYAVEECHSTGLGLQAVLLTNGVTLRSEEIEGLKTRGVEVMVSLDSVDESDFSQRPFLGGRSSTDQVVAGIDRLITHGVSPHLTITVTDYNSLGIDKVVQFALAHNLKFSLNFYRDNDIAARGSSVKFTEQRIIAGMQAAFEAIESDIPAWSVVGAILDRGQLVEPREQACGAGKDYVAIDHHGRVAKCHMEFDQPIGDISQSNLLPLIQLSPVGLQNLASREKEGCRDCEWRYHCAGGCPLVTFRNTGRYDVKSPNCNIYKAIFPLAVRLEGKRLIRYAIT